MNNTPETDLERRLAARLQPARVPGAEQAWAQVAPRLGRPGSRPAWGTLAATANALFFPNGIGGLYGSAPGAAPTTGHVATPQSATQPVGAITIAPAPSFAVYQLGKPPTGMTMIAQSFRSEAQPGNPQPPTTAQGQSVSAQAGAMAGGQPVDSATVQAANDWLTKLLNDGPETTLAIVYAASLDDLIGLVQRAAVNKILPAGEPVTVRGLPGIRTQQDGRTTITWIENGTYIELSVSSR